MNHPHLAGRNIIQDDQQSISDDFAAPVNHETIIVVCDWKYDRPHNTEEYLIEETKHWKIS